ncbi:sodium/potassium-transporting ATPase subunit beta-3-like [Seriola lalandi dorsalis]|uniref:Sodium/potassium-transporting ATPase subunit beta n=1 Tax=Seriola lalandi dorsalis TaxID=1841481 RepID=A0A3B4X2J4_SERLL|nr:sodium/potassium-transporting ATPase subunit beta-3-like [Seriola lalandi dorsalis]XP_056229133.1 sodium/potassium-transporting ATPase subunit beta-3-like [Seriola aureovittata]
MSSSPQDQNQEPNQEQEEERKEEAKAEKTEVKSEETNEEQNKERKKESKKEKKEPWNYCIYNPTTGEFLGRTASSWGLILLFYLIFYGFLAGMFSLTMWVMLKTLDENIPRHQDRVANPGLVIRPHAAEISFNRSNPTNYNHYVEQLHNVLQQYNDSVQERNDLCLVGEYTEQDDEQIKKVCQFKRSTLRQCSGLPDTSFGYAEGKPCIIIKMNRVIGLKPRGDPYINCTAKRDSVLQMQYFPSEGRLDKMFFPYYGKKAHPDYVQPLVAVKLLLTKDDYNVEQTVECKVEGTDLRNNDDRDKFQGRVTFRVMVSE